VRWSGAGRGGVLAETEEKGSKNCGKETTLEVEQLLRMGQEVSFEPH
jgi:hypothetical protein